MDSITHTVLGACVGEVVAGRKLGKKAMLFGAIANNIPDIDVVTTLWMHQADSLLAHRGFTHSILFAVLFTFIAGGIMRAIYLKTEFSTKDWLMLIGVNIFLHLLIDLFTAYGTGLFEPFSHDRIAFHMLFVADPLFTLPLLVSTAVLLILKTSSNRRKTWAFIGLAITLFYSGYALFHKLEVDEVVIKNMEEEKADSRKFMATPTPLNNFLWYVVVDRDTGFDIGYYSVFDRKPDILFRFIPKNEYLLPGNDEHVKKLIRFSEGYFTANKSNDTLVFNDLRFGQMGGWFDGDAPFVFQYNLLPTKTEESPFQQGRRKALGKASAKKMIERIKGI